MKLLNLNTKFNREISRSYIQRYAKIKKIIFKQPYIGNLLTAKLEHPSALKKVSHTAKRVENKNYMFYRA